MRAILLLCFCLCLGVPAAGWAQAPVSADDRKQIEQVITAQIDALRSGDGTRAFSYASPHIKSVFGDADHFVAMVEQGYPQVRNPRSVEFTETQIDDGRIVQHVELVGPDGASALALYAMEREPDGTWRIAGCELTRSEKIGT